MSLKKPYFSFLSCIGVYLQQVKFRTVFPLSACILICESSLASARFDTGNESQIAYQTVASPFSLLSVFSSSVTNRGQLLLLILSIFLILTVAFLIRRSVKQKGMLHLLSKQLDNGRVTMDAMMEGAERERVRIARELHDGVMVELSAVQMHLSKLGTKPQYEGDEALPGIINMLSDAIRDLRGSAHNLMPDMLVKEGLSEAVRYFCSVLQRGSAMEIDLQVYGELPKIDPKYELMLYRMVQELLQNVVKHAKASRVLVQLHYYPDLISITVEDDGIGTGTFTLSSTGGMGIGQIKQRVQLLNGRFNIKENQPKGTSVYIEVETKYIQQTNSDSYAN